MKKLISKLKFIIRMAYKNIIYSKFRALILFITFIILFLLTIMSLSTKSFLNAYFYHNLYAKYKDINLHITYDENSFARFFSIKPLNEAKNNNEILAEEINYIAAFFEITTVFEFNDEVNYVNVMASNIDNFKKVCNLPNYIEEIKAQEIIINKEFSKKYNIYEGDEIYLAVGSTKLAYKVIAIIPIDGLMSNNTVFIDKDSSISYFLKALGFNIISNDNNFNYTRNLYNHIYISIKDEHRLEEVKENIQNIKEYKDLNLVIENTIDMDIIDKYVTNFGSIMLLIIVFIFIAIIYVMQSTLNLIFEEHKSQIGIIQTLGGRKRFSFSVILTEMLMYFIPASYISYLLTQLIVNQGLKYIKSTLKYQIPTSIAFISCIIVLLVIILITLYNFIKIIKKSSLVLSLYNLSNKKVNPYISIIMFILSIFTYIYNRVYLRKILSIRYYSLINIIIAIILLFTLTRVFTFIAKLIFEKVSKKNLLSLYSLKNLNDNRIIKQTIRVLLISFLFILLLTGVQNYIKTRVNIVKNNLKLDYVITNIITNYNETYQRLVNDEKISSVDKTFFFSNVRTKEYNNIFRYCFSLEPENINQYLNVNLDNNTINQLKDETTPYIIIPRKFHYIYNIQIGDEITLMLNKEYNNEVFIVLDFIDIGYDDFIIINITNYLKYNKLNPNSILINVYDTSEVSKGDLINEFSKNLYYIIDFNEITVNGTEQLLNTTAYFSYIILIMIFCFMLTIFNNSSLELVSSIPIYSRLKVLGCSNYRLIWTIIFEKLLLLIIALFSIYPAIYLIINNISYLLIFFGTYERIVITFDSLLIGYSLCVIMFTLSYLFYFLKMRNADYLEVLKTY